MAVALTVALPVFWMLAVSSCRVRLEAVAQLPDGELALDDEQEPLPLPNSGAPACDLFPPQAATMVPLPVVNIVSNFFMQVLASFRGAVAQRTAVRSVTTLGVRKISSSVFSVVLVRVLNR